MGFELHQPHHISAHVMSTGWRVAVVQIKIKLTRCGAWRFVCPTCGKRCRVLHPPRGSEAEPLTVAVQRAWGAVVGQSGEGVWLEVPEGSGGQFWACQRCRGLASVASRLGRARRDERRLERRAVDPRTGQHRPGESWAEENRRAAKAQQAMERVCARLRRRAG